jgi:hypothetical protein
VADKKKVAKVPVSKRPAAAVKTSVPQVEHTEEFHVGLGEGKSPMSHRAPYIALAVTAGLLLLAVLVYWTVV